jgi:hypothetical protein
MTDDLICARSQQNTFTHCTYYVHCHEMRLVGKEYFHWGPCSANTYFLAGLVFCGSYRAKMCFSNRPNKYSEHRSAKRSQDGRLWGGGGNPILCPLRKLLLVKLQQNSAYETALHAQNDDSVDLSNTCCTS